MKVVKDALSARGSSEHVVAGFAGRRRSRSRLALLLLGLLVGSVACSRGYARRPPIVTPAHAAYVRILLPTDITDETDVRVVDERCSEHLGRVRAAVSQLQVELQHRLQTAGFAVMVDRNSEHDVEVRFGIDLTECYLNVPPSTKVTMRLGVVGPAAPIVQTEDRNAELRDSGFARRVADHFMNDLLSSPEVVRLAELAGTGRSDRPGPAPAASSTTPSSAGGSAPIDTGAPVRCQKDTDCGGELVCSEHACVTEP